MHLIKRALIVGCLISISSLSNSTHAQLSSIHNNCMGTGGLSAGLVSFLDSKFQPQRPIQNRCLGNIGVTMVNTGDLFSGNIMTYTLTVTNKGTRRSYNSYALISATNGLTTSTPTVYLGQIAPGASQSTIVYLTKSSSTSTNSSTATVTVSVSDSTIVDIDLSDNTTSSIVATRGSSRSVCYNPALTVPTYECEALMDVYNSTNGAGWTNKSNRSTSPNIESWFGLSTTQNDDLIAHYSFDANNAIDDAGNGYGGTLTNSPIFVDSKLGKGISLNGSNQSISLGTNVASPTMSFSAWIYRTSTAANQGIIRKSNSYAFGIRNNKLSIVSMPRSAWQDTTTEIPLNKWIHVAYTYDGSIIKVYVDGNQVWSNNGSGTYVINSNNTVIGHDTSNNRPWGGQIDEVRIYNRAISATEVSQLYINTTLKENVQKMCFGHITEQYVCNQSRNTGGTSSNNLAGTIPSSIGDFSELVTLSFNKNAIVGSLPTTIGNLRKLVSLFIAEGTQLTGALPTELGNISSLVYLYLDGNNLSGPIPNSLANTNLSYAWLGQNKFTILGDLSSAPLRQLWVNNNQLSGSLPSWFGGESLIQAFSFASNQFSGSIPSSWSGLSASISLNHVRLDSNNLHGSLDIFSGFNVSSWTTFTVNNNNFDRDHNNDALVPSNIQARLSAMSTQNLTNQGDTTSPVIQYPLGIAGVNYNNKPTSTPMVTGPYGSSVQVAQYAGSPHHVFYSKNPSYGGTAVHNIPLVSGSTYTFGFWVRTVAGTRTIDPRFTTNVNEGLSSSKPVSIDTNWKYIAIDYTYPSVGNEPRFFVTYDGCTSSCSDIQVFQPSVTQNPLIPQTVDGGFSYNLLFNENSSTTGAGFTSGLTISFTGASICQQALFTTNKILNKSGSTTIQVATLEPVTYEGCQIYVSDRAGLQSNLITLPSFTSNEYGICNTVSDITNSDCKALIDLYYSTNGASWTIKTNWRGIGDATPTTACDWFGVVCNGGRVSKLGLNSSGAIAGNISCRGEASAGNNLSGTIPQSIQNLTGLTHICADRNNLTYGFRYLTLNPSLQYIFIGDNKFVENLPTIWANPTNIKNLLIYNNYFTGTLPPSWSGLINLERMWLKDNYFTGSIPESWTNMTKLWQFIGTNMGVGGTLSSSLIDGWKSMKILSLSYNQFNGIIPWKLGSLTGLTSLSLNNNNFQGYIPESLVNLTSLGTSQGSINNNCLSVSSSYMSSSLLSTLNAKFGSWTTQNSCKGNIGSRIRYDTNGNGLLDGGETGPSDITATLRSCLDQSSSGSSNLPISYNGSVISSITSVNGSYGFSDVNPGKYYVEYTTIPQGYKFTTQNSTNIEFNGIRYGVSNSGDLTLIPNRWTNGSNGGEFTVYGSYFYPSCSGVCEPEYIGPINNGIAVDDIATGTGFILYSRQKLTTRFSSNPPFGGNSDHLIAVIYEGGQRKYNTNGTTRYSFTPMVGDVLIADVDFSADTITFAYPQANSDVYPWSAKTNCFELHNGLNELSIDVGLKYLPYSSCENTLPSYTPILVGEPVTLSVGGYGNNAVISLFSGSSTILNQSLINNPSSWALKTRDYVWTPSVAGSFTISGAVDGSSSRLDYYDSVSSSTSYRVIGPDQRCAVQGNLGVQSATLTNINQIATIPSPISYCTTTQNNTLPYASSSNQPPKMLVSIPSCTSAIVITSDLNVMCDHIIDMSANECKALVSIHNSTAGTSWTNKANWNFKSDATPRTACDWYGVTCAGGHVINLNLTSNNLSGSISSITWSNLPYINLLDLSYNSLGGNLPNIEAMSALVTLRINNNNFTGSLPSTWSSAPLLAELNMSDAGLFTGSIPSTWTGLSDTMINLNLGSILTLTGQSLPNWLGQMTKLQELYLYDNHFTQELTTQFATLTGLKTLQIQNNSFYGDLNVTKFLPLTNLYTSSYGGNKSATDNNCMYTGFVAGTTGSFLTSRFSFASNPSTDWRNQRTCDTDLEIISITKSGNLVTGVVMTYLIDYRNVGPMPSYSPRFTLTLHSGLYLMSGTQTLAPTSGNYSINVPSIGASQSSQISFTINKTGLGTGLHAIVNQFVINDTSINDIIPANNQFIDNDTARGSSYGVCIDPSISIPTYECEVLGDLYTYTSGSNWTNKTNWLVSPDVSLRYGITLTTIGSTNYVYKICLSDDRSSFACGDISDGVRGNNLSGTLPMTIGYLSQLNDVRLHSNKIYGTLPWEFANLDKLAYLGLSNNLLTSLGTGIGNMDKLDSLNVEQNLLSTLPSNLGTAPVLRFLAAGSNPITSLPDLSNLNDSLQQLNISLISWNQPLPTWISNLTSLNTLEMKSSGVSGTLNVLSGLNNLRSINLASNNISGPLPSTRSNKEFIDLSNNKINGTLPTAWSNLHLLTSLNLQNNLITGALPSSWSTMTSLQTLNLSGNKIEGELPTSWSSLVQLRDFIVPNMELDGPIPVTMFQNWTQLKSLPFTSTINNNCMYTGGVTTTQAQWMDTFWSWRNHKRCTADLQITMNKSGIDYNPGKEITYTINYLNNGPRWSYVPSINVTLNTGIVLSGTNQSVTGINLGYLAPGASGQVVIVASKRGTGIGTGVYKNEISIFDPMTKDGVDLTGLIAHYSFDNDDARDESNNGNNGVVDGVTFVQGKIGRAASFDGIDDKITIISNPFNNIFNSNGPSFTISSWIKTKRTEGPYEGDSAGTIFGQRYGDSMVFGYWGGSTSRAGKLFLNIDDTRSNSPTSNNIVNTDVWKQVVVVGEWTGTTQGKATFYIDGVIDSVVTWNAPITNQSIGFIGYDSRFLSYFQGLIDDLRIYNRALTSTEVAQLYNAGDNNTLTDTGVIKWFKYNECIDVVDIPQHECEALMDLYTYSDGSNWTTKTNRALLGDSTPNTACDRFGVKCVNNKVTQLCLAGPNTSNQCYDAWSNPGGNNLSGSLVDTIGDLSELTGLYLGANKLKGTIPLAINKLSKLSRLSLGLNNFTSLPELTGAQQLTWIHLHNNQISQPLPLWISQMSNLQGITLHQNQFTGTLPASRTGANKLWYLSLGDNPGLAGATLPYQWSTRSSLREVYMARNNMAGMLPVSWSSLTGLTRLSLRENNLTGTLPDSWNLLNSLTNLDVGINQLQGNLPSSWSNFKSLKDLRVNNNNFTGTLPSSRSTLTGLEYLDVGGSALSGFLPASWSSLNKLTTLRINSNKFLDDIPTGWFTGMTAMQNFIAYDNDLGGPIDTPIWQSWTNLGTAGSDSVISNNCFYTGSVVGGYKSWMDTYFGAQTIKPTSFWTQLYYWGNQRRCSADILLTGLLTQGNLNPGAFLTYTLQYANKGVSRAYLPRINITLHSGLTIVGSGNGSGLSIELGYLRPYASGTVTIPIRKNGIGSGTEVFTNTFVLSDTESFDADTRNNTIIHTGLVKWFKYPICSSISDISQVECESLGDFYTDFNGDGWITKTNWMGINDTTPSTACDWFGVTCAANASGTSSMTVTKLCLGHTSNPSAVCNLGSWYAGGIQNNNLSGNLPVSITNLTNLTDLNVTANTKVRGMLPDNIGDLTQLKTIGFNYGPQLTGTLPTSLTQLSNIEVLGFISNRIGGTIPDMLFTLPKLKTAWLGGNLLSGSIPQTGGSPLSDFYLPGNTNLGGPLPAWIANTTTLTWIRLQDTAISGTLPSSWSALTNLYHLDMSNMSNISGELPSSWSNRGNRINTIRITKNITGTLPSSWSSMTSLVDLRLNNNNLTGTLPASRSSLNKLNYLYLNNNNLQSSIPQQRSSLTGLTQLLLSNNNLMGPIPEWFATSYMGLVNSTNTINNNCMYIGGATSTLQTFMNTRFGSNRQTQKICNSDPALVSLISSGNLVSQNTLTYTINYRNNGPHWSYEPKITSSLFSGLMIGSTSGQIISNLTSLAPGQTGALTLIVNKKGLSQPYQIQYLNQFTISDTTITDITSSNNTLTHTGMARGSIYPICVHENLNIPQSECESLMDIYTATNGGSWTNRSNRGTNPDVSTWFGVTVTDNRVIGLNLSNSSNKLLSCSSISSGNNLYNTLPNTFDSLTSLQTLCLGNNNLSGALPSTLGTLPSLQLLSLHHNQLTNSAGVISGQTITHIDLGNNNFTGSLTGLLGNLPLLQQLRINNNTFTKGLDHIKNYPLLQSARLQYNQFDGSIPTSWTSLTIINELLIQNNNLDRDNTNQAILPSSLSTRYSSITSKLRDNQGDVIAPVISNLSSIATNINTVSFDLSFTIKENSYASGLYTSGSLNGLTLSGLYISVSGSALCDTISATPIKIHSGSTTISVSPETNGTYSNCQLVVRDRGNNASNVLTLPTFNYTQPPYRLHMMMGGSGVTINGTTVSAIHDLSPFAHVITIEGGNPLYSSSAFNSNPALQTQAGQSLKLPGIFRKQKFDNLYILSVSQPGVAGSSIIHEQSSFGSPLSLEPTKWRVNSDSMNYSQPSSQASLITSSLTNGSSLQVKINGIVQGSSSSSKGLQITGSSITTIASGLNQGYLAEMIVYTDTLDTAGLNYLESYLALKYGITLPGNYTARTASGSIQTIWNQNPSYQHQVIGLGRTTGGPLVLDQRTSSSNTNPTIMLHAQGTWSDGQYAMLGSTSGALSWTKNIASLSGYKALDRSWKIQTLGGNPVFNVSVSSNSIAEFSFPPTIIVSNDPTFATIVTSGTLVKQGDRRHSSGITFTNGQYITYIIGQSEIGGRVWLDLNRDGIQSPSEPSIQGVKVSLRQCPSGGTSDPRYLANNQSGSELTSMITSSDDVNFTFDKINAGRYYLSYDRSSASIHADDGGAAALLATKHASQNPGYYNGGPTWSDQEAYTPWLNNPSERYGSLMSNLSGVDSATIDSDLMSSDYPNANNYASATSPCYTITNGSVLKTVGAGLMLNTNVNLSISQSLDKTSIPNLSGQSLSLTITTTNALNRSHYTQLYSKIPKNVIITSITHNGSSLPYHLSGTELKIPLGVMPSTSKTYIVNLKYNGLGDDGDIMNFTTTIQSTNLDATPIDNTHSTGFTLIKNGVSIGDRLWIDEVKDNIQDGSVQEFGTGGVIVELRTSSDQIVKVAKTTSSTGHYLFTSILPGDYYIYVTNLPKGFALVDKGISTEPQIKLIDSNINPSTNKSDIFTIGFEDRLDIDIGIKSVDPLNQCTTVTSHKLRVGQSYTGFTDTYTNTTPFANILFSVKRSITEVGDYNQDNTFPVMQWHLGGLWSPSPPIKGYIAPGASQLTITSFSNPYNVTRRPQSRGFTGEMIISYSYVACQSINQVGYYNQCKNSYSISNCHTYEVTSCGDGVLDEFDSSYIGTNRGKEECDYGTGNGSEVRDGKLCKSDCTLLKDKVADLGVSKRSILQNICLLPSGADGSLGGSVSVSGSIAEAVNSTITTTNYMPN